MTLELQTEQNLVGKQLLDTNALAMSLFHATGLQSRVVKALQYKRTVTSILFAFCSHYSTASVQSQSLIHSYTTLTLCISFPLSFQPSWCRSPPPPSHTYTKTPRLPLLVAVRWRNATPTTAAEAAFAAVFRLLLATMPSTIRSSATMSLTMELQGTLFCVCSDDT